MTVENGLMPFITACDNCGKTDGLFHEVCAICYNNDECKTPIGEVVICDECFVAENEPPLIDPGESLFT
jgi:hypothetical protein